MVTGKKQGGKAMTTTTQKLRAVRLEISEEEHAALRIEAAKADTSLMQLARDAVRMFLESRNGVQADGPAPRRAKKGGE